MRIDYKYLKTFLQAKESIEDLADLMTSIGFESEINHDQSIEFDVTPNRGDFLSLKGISREYSAIKGQASKLKLEVHSQTFKENKDVIASIDQSACTHYCLGLVRNISKVKQLPANKRALLTKAEIPLIHPLVDLANYVMLEIGTPMHIFDLDKLSLPISVGYLNKPSKVQVIGGEEKELQTSTLAIQDTKRVVAMAGIIGEQTSSVSKQTINIAIESAYFKPDKIINQSRLYGLTTDAGFRFERGVDPTLQEFAIMRYLALLSEIAHFESIECHKRGKAKSIAKSIKVNIKAFKKFSDIKLGASQAVKILKLLGFEVKKLSPDSFLVNVPAFRNDVSQKEDIYEELLRITGYNNVPILEEHSFRPLLSDGSRQEDAIKRFMVSRGFNEVQNMPFVNLSNQNPQNQKHYVKLVNPLREEEAVLRQSLLPQLISNFSQNFRRGFQLQKIYEIGSGYKKKGSQYYQEKILTAAINYPIHADKNIFIIKGMVSDILSLISQKNYSFQSLDGHDSFSEMGMSIFDGKIRVASFGEIQNSLIKEKQKIYLYGFEIYLDNLDTKLRKKKLQKPSKYPFSTKDINILVNTNITYESLVNTIMEASIKNLKDVSFVDRFINEKIGKDKVSYTLRMRFQSHSSSLTDAEIQGNVEKVFLILKKVYGATPR